MGEFVCGFFQILRSFNNQLLLLLLFNIFGIENGEGRSILPLVFEEKKKNIRRRKKIEEKKRKKKKLVVVSGDGWPLKSDDWWLLVVRLRVMVLTSELVVGWKPKSCKRKVERCELDVIPCRVSVGQSANYTTE